MSLYESEEYCEDGCFGTRLKMKYKIDVILQNFDAFFHYDVNFDDHYRKIEIIQRTINKTHDELVESLKHGTHTHKKHMVHAYRKQLHLLDLQFCNDNDCFNRLLADSIKKQIATMLSLEEPIFEIITADFSHREQKTLLAPYLFPFVMEGFFYWNKMYNELRKRLEDELIKIVEICDTQTIHTYINHKLIQKFFPNAIKKESAQIKLGRFQLKKNGFDIPQKICPFLVWNTLFGYICYECNVECGGCRYAGVANENEDDWEIMLDLEFIKDGCVSCHTKTELRSYESHDGLVKVCHDCAISKFKFEEEDWNQFKIVDEIDSLEWSDEKRQQFLEENPGD
jgi:hypothetical protein